MKEPQKNVRSDARVKSSIMRRKLRFSSTAAGLALLTAGTIATATGPGMGGPPALSIGDVIDWGGTATALLAYGATIIVAIGGVLIAFGLAWWGLKRMGAKRVGG